MREFRESHAYLSERAIFYAQLSRLLESGERPFPDAADQFKSCLRGLNHIRETGEGYDRDAAEDCYELTELVPEFFEEGFLEEKISDLEAAKKGKPAPEGLPDFFLQLAKKYTSKVKQLDLQQCGSL